MIKKVKKEIFLSYENISIHPTISYQHGLLESLVLLNMNLYYVMFPPPQIYFLSPYQDVAHLMSQKKQII